MPKGSRRYLLVPAGGRGEGMGHLTRCLSLARRLPGECTLYSGCLDDRAERLLSERVRSGMRQRAPRVVHSLSAGEKWDIVILDKRRTARQELLRYSRRGTVVCIDEGGEARQWAPYLVDTLPSAALRSAANVSSPGFLELPRRKKTSMPAVPTSVLISFGGEDAADLTGAFLDAAIASGVVPRTALTVVEGPLFSRHQWPEGVTVVRGVARLSGIIAEHDLLVTHFGMTALESLALGVPVVLLNPTRYHRSLGAQMGIPDIGVGKPDMGALSELLRNPGPMGDAVERLDATLAGTRGSGLASYLSRLGLRSGEDCPACHAVGNPVIGRYPERTYYACKGCGIVYLQSFAPEGKLYGKGYFFEEYRRQYGKTYLEDFETIRGAGRQRIALLARECGVRPPGLVMDVGCAYGPFLAALRDEGYRPFGIDVSAEAVRHVTDVLGIPAACASFEDLDRRSIPRGSVEAVTLWYVVEHVQDLSRILKKAAGLLPPGGGLAFSTPNGSGVSARHNRPDFLERSPGDHYTVLSPRDVGGILRAHGFILKHIRVTGVHPERFPGLLGRLGAQAGPVRSLLSVVSRAGGLGDTFEAYAVKAGAR
jgi:SAM-dependent methyltransferase/spore coat polysaccharide biosynthesis predicted glycosyltransferase SpsG